MSNCLKTWLFLFISEGSDLVPVPATDPERWFRILLESCILLASSCQRADWTFSCCNYKCPVLFSISYLLYNFPTFRLPPGLCVPKLYSINVQLNFILIYFISFPSPPFWVQLFSSVSPAYWLWLPVSHSPSFLSIPVLFSPCNFYTLYVALSSLCSHCCHRCHSGRYPGHQIYGRYLPTIWRCNCCKNKHSAFAIYSYIVL